MKTFRAISIGIWIWALGVAAFSLAFFVPLMENVELQANLTLCLAVIPLVWYGSRVYYKKDSITHGFKVGLVFFGMAALLDALITVPFLVMPQGGDHYEFFTAPGFWLIGLEFLATATLYWKIKIRKARREFI